MAVGRAGKEERLRLLAAEVAGLHGSLQRFNRASYLADALWILAENSVRYTFDAKEIIKICCPEFFGEEQENRK